MKKYHKIQTVFKRDPENNHKTLLLNDYSLPEFEYLKDNIWVFTEKVDGTNIRVIFENGQFEFKGKSDNADVPQTLIDKLVETYIPKKELFKEMFEGGVCLYGEGYGPKIQSGGKYLAYQDFVLFDVNIDGWWLQRKDVQEISTKLKIRRVPIIGTGTLATMVEWAEHGILSTWGDFEAEGIVARPLTEFCTRNGDRLITKIKCRDFERQLV